MGSSKVLSSECRRNPFSMLHLMMSESLMNASMPCKLMLSNAWSNISVLIKDAEKQKYFI